MERLYIYKLTFKSGATYIGQHVQRRMYDDYISSSSYMKKSNDPVVSRDILIDNVKDRETLDILETISIIEDKQVSPHNVNGNYGSYYYNFRGGWNKGLPVTEEERELNRQKRLGKKMPEEAKRRISMYQRGCKHRRGHHLSEEHKRKISEGNKGRVMSESTRLKLSLSLTGKKISEEHRKNLSLSHIGKTSHLGCKATPEQRKRMSDAHLGYHQSEETKKKISKYNIEHREEKREFSKNRIMAIKIAYMKAKEDGYKGKWNDFQKLCSKKNITEVNK